MKRYSILHPLWLAFYSRDLYADVGRNWKGLGLTYLLLLLALCWVPIVVRLHGGGTSFQKEAEFFIAQVPPITIRDGELSTDVPTPHFIRDDKGETVAIIDLTGKFTSLDETGAKMLVTKSKVLVRRSRAETRVYDLSGVRSFSLTQAKMRDWLHLGVKWFPVIAYPFVVLFSFVYRIIQVFLYGGLGVLFARSAKVSLDCQSLVRLAAIAVTPAIILDTIRDLAGWKVQHWWLVCFAVAMAYLFFAVKANAERETVS